jgi:uncharacterized membrane protein
MESAEELFSDEQQQQILAAVTEAEKRTSGEIRIYIEKSCTGDPLDRAAFIFEELGMHKTAERNGVLFYVATGDHKFVVIGDAGINAVVPADFWDKIKEAVLGRFRQGHFTEGLIEGVGMAGHSLQEHFPYQRDDINELPDDIVFGKDV